MTMLVPRGRRRKQDPAPPERDGSLPLRWALIVVASLGGGLAVGYAVGLVSGVTIGLAIAGLLHKVLART